MCESAGNGDFGKRGVCGKEWEGRRIAGEAEGGGTIEGRRVLKSMESDDSRAETAICRPGRGIRGRNRRRVW
jgi:hypothetical protein